MGTLMLISLIVATVIPLLVLTGIYRLNLYATSSFREVLLCFAWGLLAFGIAYGLNSVTVRLGALSYNEMRRFGAPVVEEMVKGLFLILLVRRPRFSYFVDGAIYGFAIGVGFAIVENYLYIFQFPDSAFSLALGRVLSTNLMHASASAIVGISTGLFRFQQGLPARAGAASPACRR